MGLSSQTTPLKLKVVKNLMKMNNNADFEQLLSLNIHITISWQKRMYYVFFFVIKNRSALQSGKSP